MEDEFNETEDIVNDTISDVSEKTQKKSKKKKKASKTIVEDAVNKDTPTPIIDDEPKKRKRKSSITKINKRLGFSNKI
jgi:hypothetical protein